MRERLGDVPIAVLEKGKQPGSHLLSGAVVNPRALRELFRGRLTTADIPTYGEVPGEAVYVLTRSVGAPDPAAADDAQPREPRPLGLALGRFLAEQAEAVGAVVLPETSATKLLVQHGRVSACAPATGAAAARGSRSPTFEAGNDIVAGLTVLAEGSQGLLTAAAIDDFGLRGANPQIWALGVKEVWRVPRPLRKIVHTMGWPLRTSAELRRVRRLVHLPDGRRPRLASASSRASSTRDVEFSVHDVLQEFKTHRLVWKILARRRAGRLGREDDHRGRLPLAAVAASTRPGCCSSARAPGS